MSEELKVLIRKRGSVKARLTLFNKYLSELNQDEITKEKIIELETRLDKFNSLLNEFNDIQNQIEVVCEEDNLETQYDIRAQFQDNYFREILESKKILGKFYELNDANKQENSVVFNQTPPNIVDPVNCSGIKLPQISLPTFSGTYEKWLEFKDTFESLIHSNNSISDIQKFHYLRASLDGMAKQIIYSLDFSASNYNIAWDILCKRFDNKRLLVQNHIKGIFNIPVISQESAEKLRKLIDTVNKHLRALGNLQQPVEHWDSLIIFQLTSKLDNVTLREWEGYRSKNEMPTLQDFIEFIQGRADLLETLEVNSKSKNMNSKDTGKQRAFVAATNNNTFQREKKWCTICKQPHDLSMCKKFLDLSVSGRVTKVKQNRLCLNCLGNNHLSYNCKVQGCSKCGLKHHHTLHYETKPQEDTSGVDSQNSQGTSANLTTTLSNKTSQHFQGETLLSTAIIQVCDSLGKMRLCRALLDSASMSNFISQGMCDQLGLVTQDIDVSVSGLSTSSTRISKKCEIVLRSNHSSFQARLSCLVISQITDEIPIRGFDRKILDIPNYINLADPDFCSPSEVDILIGANLFWKLICNGQILLGEGLPVLQNTHLGWIVSGEMRGVPCKGKDRQKTLCNFNMNLDIQDQLTRFWEVEEPCPKKNIASVEDATCEDLFVNTTYRDCDGRFVVSIPFKISPKNLGDSKQVALSRLWSLERRFSRDVKFKQDYCAFMSEYERSGYMSKVESNVNEQICYYLPHHGVIKESSSTTRLRVVFDGSASSDNGASLNDLQYVGPKIQEDLVSILLRFRLHKIAFSGDIAKMYLQVWVSEEQRPLQRILWRSDPAQEVEVYNLNTVTFGLASSPFLAVRCVKQLAIDFAESNSKASRVISRDFFVDDMLSGADSEEEATQICKDISDILSSAGFELRKFNSNSKEVLSHLKNLNESNVLSLGENEKTKTLGLYWECDNDILTYQVGLSDVESSPITKRKILSEICQIFDPLGLVSPCIIIPKILLQKLWLLNLTWDDVVPSDVAREWQRFRSELSILNSFSISRFVCSNNSVKLEIHGFSDASLNAYAACIYVRSINSQGFVESNLLCAKSKVAPIKALTIPKLELCGALLLARLLDMIKNSLHIQVNTVFLWCDSNVVLSWIRSPASKFQVFVANRISQIQSLTNPQQWHHVKSEENPADIASRGYFPSDLKDNDLWFHGPSWLLDKDEINPLEVSVCDDLPERRKTEKSFLVVEKSNFDLFNRFSSYVKLIRVFAYVLRFWSNCIKVSNRKLGPLTPEELDESESFLMRIAQGESFPEEINLLKGGKNLKKGPLSSLSPFIDEKNIIRVGGRLQLSEFSHDKKHPIVLSSKHILTKLLFINEHQRLMHSGPQMLLSSIREKFWPLGGRNLARKVTRDCIRCVRAKPPSFHPQMGILPKTRVNPQPPFFIVGVDYAGPVKLKTVQGRSGKITKAYICLFICFVTRAIHLELVSSLSTDAFMSTFRRFVARRGKPQRVYSDNGKNFVGAQAELTELGEFLDKHEKNIVTSCANEGVQWSFIPVHSPHFGGIWEAGVKSSKYCLKRVIADEKLTFEGFSTVLCQVESILNSRPLVPMSSDPSDLDILTPGHFLIGRRLTSIPDPKVTCIQENRLSIFQRQQKIVQLFWSRWTREYICELQSRNKWKYTQNELKENMLVLIKDNDTNPLCWRLGRVVSIHPGPDGVARVATIRTAEGVIKRSFSKLCPLPVKCD